MQFQGHLHHQHFPQQDHVGWPHACVNGKQGFAGKVHLRETHQVDAYLSQKREVAEKSMLAGK